MLRRREVTVRLSPGPSVRGEQTRTCLPASHPRRVALSGKAWRRGRGAPSVKPSTPGGTV